MAAGWRTGLVRMLLAGAIATPFVVSLSDAGGLATQVDRIVRGFGFAVDSVGWVLVPQLLIGLGVGGLAVEHLLGGLAGATARATPRWLGPALESALLLGMLGTLSGMVSGFTGLTPDELQPGPLVHGLGTALRSSFVGFTIALVGVWIRNDEEQGDRAIAGGIEA